MNSVSILGTNRKPILYASLADGNLRFQFEYYSRGPNEGDYEFIHTVLPEDFPSITTRFGLDPQKEILAQIQEISDLGRGTELHDALTKNEIKNDIWVWSS
jgi:hypothetical protein